jgi:hypothetical protein
MSLSNIFDLCRPRDDVAKGTIADSDYAANLANVLTGRASRDYTDAPTFFTNSGETRWYEGWEAFALLLTSVGTKVADCSPRLCGMSA